MKQVRLPQFHDRAESVWEQFLSGTRSENRPLKKEGRRLWNSTFHIRIMS